MQDDKPNIIVPARDVAAARRRLRAAGSSRAYDGQKEDLLAVALEEGLSVTPQQAIAAVERFGKDAPRICFAFYMIDAWRPPWFWIHAELPSLPDRTCSFTVRALDGFVESARFYYLHSPPRPTTRDQALKLAEEYLDSIFREWRGYEWTPIQPQATDQGEEWYFSRMRLLDNKGLLQAEALWVSVEKATGRIRGFGLPPPIRFTGREQPRLRQEKALEIAASVAVFDPEVYEISELHPQLEFDPITGFSSFEWYGRQRNPEPGQPPSSIHIDDLWGFADASQPPGTPADAGERPPRSKPTISAPEGVVVTTSERIIGNTPYAKLLEGQLWIRPEMLRLAGCRVELGKEIRRPGGTTATFGQLGARKDGDEWWVPLLPVARQLGWSVE